MLLQENPEDGGWYDLVANGFIEYIDSEEEETNMISMTIDVSRWTSIAPLLKSGVFG